MRLLFSLLLILFLYTAHAQGNWQWVTSGYAGGYQIVTLAGDSDGNIYVAGQFNSDSVVFGDLVLHSPGNQTYSFVVKYDSSGHAEWARKIGPGWVHYTMGSRLIDVDLNSNVVLIVHNLGSIFSYNDSTIALTPGTESSLIKIDPNGELLFARSTSPTQNLYPRGLEVDYSNNIIVAGSYYGNSITVDTFTCPALHGTHSFVAKFDNAGNAIWMNASDTATGNQCNAVAIDERNNIYLAGLSSGSFDLYNPVFFSHNRNMYLSKSDSLGNIIWIESVGMNTHAGVATSIICRQDKINITGHFVDSLFFSSGLLTISANSIDSGDIFLLQYDTSGTLNYKSAYGGNLSESPYEIVCDDQSNIYIAGTFESDTIPVGSLLLHSPPGSGLDVFLIKFTDSGNPLWTFSPASSIWIDRATSLFYNNFNKLFVAGFYQDTLIFPPFTINNGSMFLACMNDQVTAVNDVSEPAAITLFPNPAGSAIKVVSEMDFQSAVIIDISGRFQTLAGFETAERISVSSLDPGIYILQLTDRNNVIHSLRFVKYND